MTSPEHDAVDEVYVLLDEYKHFLSGKAEGTTEAYLRTVRQLIAWIAQLPGNAGWLKGGYKGSKWRDIDLLDEARAPLYAYLQATRDIRRTYVFMSQRSERLTEEGIHYWFRTLKAQATADQWALIEDLTFHDLRYDFAYRAREAGWSLEEVAHYLGLAIKKGG